MVEGKEDTPRLRRQPAVIAGSTYITVAECRSANTLAGGPWIAPDFCNRLYSMPPVETLPIPRSPSSISLAPYHSEIHPEMLKSRGWHPANTEMKIGTISDMRVVSPCHTPTCTSTVTSTPFCSIFSANSCTSSMNVSAPPNEIKVLG